MVDREHDMRIGTGKQIAAASLDPPVTRVCLAARAVPVALWGVILYGECDPLVHDVAGLGTRAGPQQLTIRTDPPATVVRAISPDHTRRGHAREVLFRAQDVTAFAR